MAGSVARKVSPDSSERSEEIEAGIFVFGLSSACKEGAES
jgi:hypothetical protein